MMMPSRRMLMNVRMLVAVSAIAMAGATLVVVRAQHPAGPAAQGAAGGGAGGRGGAGAPTVESMLWSAFDSDKNGAVTRAEVKSAFDAWYAAADSAKSGSVALQPLADAINKAIAPAPAAAPAAADAGGAAGAGGARGGGGGGRATQEF